MAGSIKRLRFVFATIWRKSIVTLLPAVLVYVLLDQILSRPSVTLSKNELLHQIQKRKFHIDTAQDEFWNGNRDQHRILSTDTASTNKTRDGKSEQWFLKALRGIRFHRPPSPNILSSDPFFRPGSVRKYDISDVEILTPDPCSGATKLVVLVLSRSRDSATRSVIRQTWGSVASQRSWPGVSFQMDIKLVFVLAIDKKSKQKDDLALYDEAAQFKDMLQTDSVDSFANLTRKVITGLQWTTKHCTTARYVLKADQDIFVNVPLLWQFLKRDGQRHVVYGTVYNDGAVVHRQGRYMVSESAYPLPRFPQYASGTAYVLSMDYAQEIVDTYSLFLYIPMEDAFLTGVLGIVNNVTHITVDGFTNQPRPTPEVCLLAEGKVFMANRMTDAKLRQFWSYLSLNPFGFCN